MKISIKLEEIRVVLVNSNFSEVRSSKFADEVIKDKSVIVMDCGALQTITNSLINCCSAKR